MTNLPPDQSQRLLIAEALDRNLLVEAAAGTGKTTSMVGRMIALLRSGQCPRVGSLVAVTFTRKAAAELRGRFQVGLEKALRREELPAEEKARLTQALAHVEQCFMGTIHAFCARLLRERPVEAGVDLTFRETDEKEDQRLREEAWDRYVARCYAEEDPILQELDRAGLEIGRLKQAFLRYADYPDVDDWPAPDRPAPDLQPAAQGLHDYVRHMRTLIPDFPREKNSDRLMAAYEQVARMASHAAPGDDPALIEIFASWGAHKPVLKWWLLPKDRVKEEGERWKTFRKEIAQPALRAWRAYCYGPVLRTLAGAREVYDALRAANGVLNFQDLLMQAAVLLRSNPGVRAYFRKRFSHLLVDEFQDTDPVQAEVMLLLTADDPHQSDWRRCCPEPGALFVVGDPKQSIYRFRRADIVTYNEVKRIIEASGGQVVHLTCSFRTLPTGVDWVNRVFEPEFPKEATNQSPAYVRLEGWQKKSHSPLEGIFTLDLQGGTKDELIEEEADFLARSIRGAVDSRIKLPDGRPVKPGDFLIVTQKTASLSRYAEKLEALGLPHQVSGGRAMNEVEELFLLHQCLSATAAPDNPIVLVALLRGPLVGISDRLLYTFKRSGGCFNYWRDLPEKLPEEDRKPFEEVFTRLKQYRIWFNNRPLLSAVERIIDDLGLSQRALAAPGGNDRAGSLAKAVEVIRAAQEEWWTPADLVDYLANLIRAEEKHDGLVLDPLQEDPVRIMNLHKVKGLEAPMVFLADPTGAFSHPLSVCIDRSGDRVRGYLAVTEQRGFQQTVLAAPEDWEERETRERVFLEEEKKRLRYVAATRAGVSLTISRRSQRQKLSPWYCFENHLEECRPQEDPGEVKAPVKKAKALAAGEAEKALVAITASQAAMRESTYHKKAAKSSAQSKAKKRKDRQEHGTEWGSVIHLLLETALSDSRLPLEELAVSALLDQNLDPARACEAVDLVQRVMASEIWKRAQNSDRRFTEIPIQVRVEKAGKAALMRGVIDLVFLEKGGWVIVDYKTDPLTEEGKVDLPEKYIEQLENYRLAWEQATGESVSETGLYFTAGDRYQKLTP